MPKCSLLDQKHYCSDPGNIFLNGMNIYYIQEYALMASNTGFGSYNLLPGVRIMFFPNTRYGIWTEL